MPVRDQAERDRLTEAVTTRHVDGVLPGSVRADDRLPGILEEVGLRTVLTGRRDEHERLVDCDHAGGATESVRHLPRSGRTRVATITGPLDREAGHSRLAGRRAAGGETGVRAPELPVGSGVFTEEGAAGRCVRFLTAHRIRMPCSPRPVSGRSARSRNCGARDGRCPGVSGG